MSLSPNQTDATVENLIEESATRSGNDGHIERRSCTDRRSNNRRANTAGVHAHTAAGKDTWDKVAAVAPIISGFLIFVAGGVFTYAFNQQQLRLQEVQTIERFIPHLTGNEQSKKAAILAISSLTNAELAGKIASIFASSGTVSALQSMATTGSDKEKSIASKALSDALENLAARESKLSDIESAYKDVITATAPQPTNSDAAYASQARQDLPANLSRLADLYRQRGQFAMAETLYKKVISDNEKLLGAENPQVAESLRSLAAVYLAQGKKPMAELTFKRVRDIEAKNAPQVKADSQPQAEAPKEQPASENEHPRADADSDAAGAEATHPNSSEAESK